MLTFKGSPAELAEIAAKWHKQEAHNEIALFIFLMKLKEQSGVVELEYSSGLKSYWVDDEIFLPREFCKDIVEAELDMMLGSLELKDQPPTSGRKACSILDGE